MAEAPLSSLVDTLIDWGIIILSYFCISMCRCPLGQTEGFTDAVPRHPSGAGQGDLIEYLLLYVVLDLSEMVLYGLESPQTDVVRQFCPRRPSVG